MSRHFPKVHGRLFLAPMAGISDAAFRLQCRMHGAALAYTEMISADSLARSNEAAKKLAYCSDAEKPCIAQLFGQDVKKLVDAARIIEENHDFAAIDINMGCPATKIIKEGAGSALLKRKNKVAEIISEVSSALDLPLTAKIRSGISFKDINAVEIARIIEDNGASAIAVHARVAIQGYGGKADWNVIKSVKEAVNIPVIGNGDVSSPELAARMLKETGCDYVMIGRAARGNPYIFEECRDYLATGKYQKHDAADRKMAFLEFLTIAERPEIKGSIDFKSIKVHAGYFTKGLAGGARIREKLAQTKTVEDVRKLFG